ncbi:MAG: NRDE family protein [Gammaproteobacteria bacterium]|nr:NRDE family protein [Gammaproteobacteria bacterium]
MCIILLAYRTDKNYPLIVAANRDEFFDRPTVKAQYWSDYQNVFAGRDEEQGGTWLGVTQNGRFAAVTNWTERTESSVKFRSRGHVVRDFLTSNIGSDEFTNDLDGHLYRGFNLVLFDGCDLIYWSNRSDEKKVLESGFYGVTNTSLDNDWTKTRVGVSMIAQVTNRHDVDSLIHMLRRHSSIGNSRPVNQELAESHQSPCFVFGETYGTRASTAVVFDDKRIYFKEQQYGPRAVLGSSVYKSIPIQK